MPARSAPPAAPFRGENEQCCSASPRDVSEPRGEVQRRCWEVGGEEGGTLQYEPHSDGTAISVPAPIKADFII